MKIGIDVESGERPFNELVEGVLYSSVLYPSDFFFIIGDSYKIRSCFPKIAHYSNVILADAKSVITMEESPLFAVKRKKNSTVVTGIELIKNRTIDAFFSPGNTGATVVAAQLGLGTFTGLKRPALGSFFPRMNQGESFILDVGANPEFREDCLYHNGILGSAFYRIIFGEETPRIGLLSIGTETGKGNAGVKKAYHLLSSLEGFSGNIEPYNLIDGSVDVAVTDGFTGNTILKTAETLKKLFSYKFKSYVKEKVSGSLKAKMMFYPLGKILTDKKANSDFTDTFLPKYYGAAPLLGVNGSVFIGHGKTAYKDVINAIDFALEYHKRQVTEKLLSVWKNK